MLTKQNNLIILTGKSICVGMNTITKEMIEKAKRAVKEQKNER